MMPSAASTYSMAWIGNSKSCFFRVNRSSSAAATRTPSLRSAAAASWKKQEMPRMYTARTAGERSRTTYPPPGARSSRGRDLVV